MNNLDTAFLSTRLHDLADELTPRLEVTAQVRGARSRYRRQRRGRLAVIGTVAATLAVVGVPTAIGALSSAQAPHGQTARPGVSTPTTSSVPSDSARAAAEERLKAATTADQSLAGERLKAAQSAAARQVAGG
jgi:hypothetical protein